MVATARTSTEPVRAAGIRAAILGVDDVVAAELFLGLGERTVSSYHLPVPYPYGPSTGTGFEPIPGFEFTRLY
jgi:hypothetical protein